MHLVLNAMKLDLQKLAPEFVVFAEEAVATIDNMEKIEDVYINKADPEDLVNLVAPISANKKSTVDWPVILESIRQKCIRTKEVINTFIKETYTLEHFRY